MFEYRAKLIKVIDGDTIDVMVDLGFGIFTKQRLRLAGINTPESRTSNEEEKKKGLLAKKRLSELLQNDIIIKTTNDKQEKYGRLLATIFVNDKNINEQLITEGFADAYSGEKR